MTNMFGASCPLLFIVGPGAKTALVPPNSAPVVAGLPVPRLTLLFFGAAKDIPEAAKTVTAGQPAGISKCKPTAKLKPCYGP
jgi:hypothetical protein